MLDLIFLAATFLLFRGAIAYTHRCDRIWGASWAGKMSSVSPSAPACSATCCTRCCGPRGS